MECFVYEFLEDYTAGVVWIALVLCAIVWGFDEWSEGDGVMT